MTKILRIITRLNIGGPAIHVTNLNYYLDKDYGYESILVYGSLAAGEGSMEYLAKEKNLRTINIPGLGREISFFNDLKILWQLFQIIKKEKPDIVHTHTAKAGLAGRVAAKLAGVKKIYHTFHGNVFNGYFGTLKTKIFILLEQLLALISTNIIAISEKQKQDLLKYKITTEQKIKVITLGFELDKLAANSQKNYLRNLLNLPEDTKLVGLVGRIVPIKNHQYYIEIAEKVLRKIDNVRFLIVGDGELKSAMQNLIAKKALTNKILITGFVQPAGNIYNDLDIVALTSKNEGTPVTLIEALAFDKPVISTDVGGVRDILQNGKYGYLETLDNPEKFSNDLINMLFQPEQSKEMAKLGRKYIYENYDIKVLLKNIYNLYMSVSTFS